MAGQEQVRAHGGHDDGEGPDDTGQVQAQLDATALDDVLDEIDSVLEDNAEEFVSGFIQKGGQ